MKPRGLLQVARGSMLLFMIAAWLVASDHCALAGVLLRPGAPMAAAAQESCPGHSQPEKKPIQGALPCCKTLVAAPAPAKIGATYDANAFAVHPYFALEGSLVVWRADTLRPELDTGPPDTRTFAESVLQRSLLAHAPPRLG